MLACCLCTRLRATARLADQTYLYLDSLLYDEAKSHQTISNTVTLRAKSQKVKTDHDLIKFSILPIYFLLNMYVFAGEVTFNGGLSW